MFEGVGLRALFTVEELRKRLFFTLGILFVYRLGIYVPTPGVDYDRLRGIMEAGSQGIFGLVNLFSGGAFEQFSVLALGIMPYINVSIAVQLLSSVVKSIQDLNEQGERGRRILSKYIRYATFALALIHGCLTAVWLEGQGVVATPGWSFRLVTALTLACGTMFLMWIGEQLTERGLGNGISMLIMAGIVARMPVSFLQTLNLANTGELTPGQVLLVLIFALATVLFVVYIERSSRKIPVHYSRRMSGSVMMKQSVQHLPVKLNNAGVIPAIFGSMVVLLIGVLIQYLADMSRTVPYLSFMRDAGYFFAPSGFAYNLTYAALIIFFAFFWIRTVPSISPDKIADGLKKNGGFVPGVRPGKETAAFLKGLMERLTLWGALYICLVCIAPSLYYERMNAGVFAYFFGGTAVLIVIGVSLDLINQVYSYVLARNYETMVSQASNRRMAKGKTNFSRLILNR